jgi:nucleotide-binding universal stress UspA family protein
MSDLRPVVVGFDGSVSGADALALGRVLAEVSGGGLVVAVVHPAPAAISPARVDAEWVADRHRLAEEFLDAARRSLGPAGAGVDYRVVASSSVAHGLHDLAEEVGAGSIVVGSHPVGAQPRLFAGSTAERLLSGSVCPVAVAPPGQRDREPRRPVRIGVAYIDAPEALVALRYAAGLAARVDAELRLYTVVADEAEVLPLVLGRDAERAFLATAREAYQTALDLAIAGLPDGTRASGHLRTGSVVDVLAGLAADGVDLLVCGSRGYGPVRRVLLGGVSSRLVRDARLPVVVVPRGD